MSLPARLLEAKSSLELNDFQQAADGDRWKIKPVNLFAGLPCQPVPEEAADYYAHRIHLHLAPLLIFKVEIKKGPQ
ncbi:hypothetical protein IH992_05445 [Candidatus Poribacteria bacterium]|nr:hypothetical protein [Candidatus Poribacteria bacterium]